MNQLLPRGYSLSEGTRIKKMVAFGDDWQIYLTNHDTYTLAVNHSLYEKWVVQYSVPEGIFLLKEDSPTCRVFASKGNYLVSTIDKGPYPVNAGQVEAFSMSFNTALKLYSDMDVRHAIYIEEYSLLLPTTFSSEGFDPKVAYGKWITGGVNVSIDSFARVKQLTSWLSNESLEKSVELAGFMLEEKEQVKDETVSSDNHREGKSLLERHNGEKFKLTGRPELETFFNDNIVDIVLHREEYQRMGISFPGATILHGPPGCGKTYAVEKLSEYLGWPRFDIDSGTIASSFIHDTSKKISEMFNAAMDTAPSILVIDEMEAFLSDRNMGAGSGTHHVEEVAEFLRRIPEAISKGVLVFAMTNMIDSIDPAILRRGRFDHIVEVKMATAEEIETLLTAQFKELPVDENVNVREIAKRLSGRPLSDVTFILREAGKTAVKNKLERMDECCFLTALQQLPREKKATPIGFGTQEES